MIGLECIDGPLFLNAAHIVAVEPAVSKKAGKRGANCTVYLSSGISYGIKEYAGEVVELMLASRESEA